jgi:hypothetical protein
MAGEWIALDVGLPDKPEVQELLDVTGEQLEVVVFRLYKLWSWAALNCEDGTAKMTPTRLARVCGGEADFWRAVASVGWLEFDETAATVAVPGWDRRFSQAAKSRAQQADRAKAYEDRNPGRKRSVGPSDARASDAPTAAHRRGDRGDRGEYPPPPPRDAWEKLRAAWNAGPGRPWKPPEPPDGLQDRLAEPGWLDEAVEAIGRLRGCQFFKSPVTLIQFTKPGFVRRVMGGQYDDARAAKAVNGHAADPPKRQLPDDFTEAVRRTNAAIEARRREAS